MAAASLSIAFEVFGKEPWPAMLQPSAYTAEEVQSCKDRLRAVQATFHADHLRRLWSTKLEDYGSEKFHHAWAKAQQIVMAPQTVNPW